MPSLGQGVVTPFEVMKAIFPDLKVEAARQLDRLARAQAERQCDPDPRFGAGARLSFGAVLSAGVGRPHHRRDHAKTKGRWCTPPIASAWPTCRISRNAGSISNGRRTRPNEVQVGRLEDLAQQRGRHARQYVQRDRAPQRQYHQSEHRRGARRWCSICWSISKCATPSIWPISSAALRASPAVHAVDRPHGEKEPIAHDA